MAITFAVSTQPAFDEGDSRQRQYGFVDHAEEDSIREPTNKDSSRIPMNNRVRQRRGRCPLDGRPHGLKKFLAES
ncbi:MAG TPA: hypothetical protein VGG33_12980, partial [Polyangia bacterium]